MTPATDFVGDFEIDRSLPVPAYYQLEDWLTQRIDSGELVPGTQLPPERELTERLGISRMTLRQALDRLQRESRLVRRQGRGTFVGSLRVVNEIGQLQGISAELAAQGRSSQTRVLSVDRSSPTRLARQALGLTAGVTAIRVRRVRSVDDEPLSLETSWLHPQLCAAVLEEKLADSSLNRVLVEQCGLDLVRAHEQITATVLDSFESLQLEAETGLPAFRVQRTTWDATGAAVEFVISVIRADRFRFEASLGQPGAAERTAMLIERRSDGGRSGSPD